MLARLQSDPLVSAQLGDLSSFVDPQVLTLAQDPQHCFSNAIAQPLICLYQMTVCAALLDAGILPAVVAGYSLGELSAWGVAGALSPAAVLSTAARRAAAMDQAAPADAGLLAVRGLRCSAVRALLDATGASLAIDNGEDHIILAGTPETLAAVEARLAGTPAQVVRLPVSVPAHSPLLSAAVPVFHQVLESLHWNRAGCAVLAGIDGQPRYTSSDAIETLSRQLAQTIVWVEVLDIAVEMGTTCFFEIGPGNALSRMVRDRHPDVEVRAYDDFATGSGAISWLRQRAPSAVAALHS